MFLRAHPIQTPKTPFLKLTPLAAALAAGLFAQPAMAANITVDGTICTLADAISAANTNATVGGCVGDAAGLDTLSLPASTILSSALPTVTSAISILGNGGTVMRDASAAEFRIFTVTSTGNLSLDQTTVSGGSVSGYGGGILSYGVLSLSDCTVSGNTASPFTFAGRGGGIYIDGGLPATLTMSNSRVSGNVAATGGGIRHDGGSAVLNISSSTISGNTATYGGGGIYNDIGGTLTLTNSTVSGNRVISGSGGGIYNDTSGARLILDHSTVSGNSALGNGGGLFQFNAGTSVIGNSLISGNSAGGSGAEVGASGTVTANDSNLFGHSALTNAAAFSGFTPGASDIDATIDGGAGILLPTALASILNTTLANNGGLSFTHALPAGSPAIDAVAGTCPPPSNDQRGFSRPADGNASSTAECDIGAFELQPPADTTPETFTFTDVTGAALSTVQTSNAVTITGINTAAAISVTGGTYSIGCTATFTSLASTINNNQTVCVRHTASASSNTAVDTTLTVGSVSDTYTSTTATASTQPTIRIKDVILSEERSGTRIFRFRVSLSAAATGPVTVAFSTANGTAMAGSDYIAKSGTLTLPAGIRMQQIQIMVKGDRTRESDETFFVNLSGASGGTIADSQGKGTIRNDD
ncbi:MAG: choice-of-anchor Q domain-containing protein [Panacagrimonas sp.]